MTTLYSRSLIALCFDDWIGVDQPTKFRARSTHSFTRSRYDAIDVRFSGDVAEPDPPAPGLAGNLPAVAGQDRPRFPCGSSQASVLDRIHDEQFRFGSTTFVSE